METLAFDTLETGEHDFATFALFEKTEDGVPLQTAPFLAFVVGAEDRDDEVSFFS